MAFDSRRLKSPSPSASDPGVQLAILHPRSRHPPDPSASTSHHGNVPQPAHEAPYISADPDSRESRASPSGLAVRIRGFLMKATHIFPLLRTAPGFGTGSYGAIPASPPNYASSDALSSDDERSDVSEGMLSPSDRRMWIARRRRLERSNLSIDEVLSSPPPSSHSERPRLQTIESEAVIDLDLDGAQDEEEDPNDPADNSPYAEVRASVLATDDDTMSINTPRMWTLSLLFSLVGSSTNLFFSLRYPSISITPVIALLLAHPLGKIWDGVFPEAKEGKVGRIRCWLGKGRWNRKEHACVYIASNVAFGFAFATDVIVEQTHFYKQDPGITYQILLTLSTQILGYTFAGLTRQWLVHPSSMIWPGTLMSTAMFTTLHGEENRPADGWRISRWKFFNAVFVCGFLWYFIPGFLMPALSSFNVMTWFAPDNVVVSNLFGVRSGLGMFPLTFDWAMISYTGSPLMTPFWAAANVFGGLLLVMYLIAPLLYYANAFYSAYMPILSSSVFDNTGHMYDVSRVLTENYVFDEQAYKSYSPVFLPITYALSYALQFAALTALITHTALWHGKDIWRQWRRSLRHTSSPDYKPINPTDTRKHRRRRRKNSNLSDEDFNELIQNDDVHMRLMRNYKECPTSWYLLIFVVMTTVAIFVVEYYPVYLPWYGLLLALAVCGVFFVPIGIIMAITNTQSSLFLICQLICGGVFPGRPVANMVFVSYGYITSTQGLKFSSDLKLGHYMKIPPRLLFTLQLVATIVSSLTQIGVLNWMFRNIPGICTEQAMNGFTCPIARVHFNGSILWGVVGPSRFFGPGEMYRPLVWAFLFGLISPFGVYLLWRAQGRKRSSMLKKVSLPVLLGSLSWIPPATGLNFSCWAAVCFAFNYLVKRRKSAWWAKYTMTLSAALDASLAFGLVFVFFFLLWPEWEWVNGLKWWGTEIYKQGCDWKGCAYKGLPEEGHFGPPAGSW